MDIVEEFQNVLFYQRYTSDRLMAWQLGHLTLAELRRSLKLTTAMIDDMTFSDKFLGLPLVLNERRELNFRALEVQRDNESMTLYIAF